MRRKPITGSAGVGNVTTLDEFVGVVSVIREAGIRVDITMNSTCDGGDWYAEETLNRQIGFIRDMHEQHGIEAVTLANPFLIEQARQTCPNLEISASVLADIDCFSRAEAFALAGATTMTVDTSINRDLKLLRQIREKLGVELKLMVNEGCLNKCPYRKFHMNLISHKSHEERDEGNAFSFACGDIIGRDAGQIFKSNWIRPEDMRRYEGITSFFKIVGRDMMPSKVLRCTEAYLDESYDGNLFDLLCSSIGYYGIEFRAHIDNKALGRTNFFKRTSICNRQCQRCAYCAELADELLGYGWITREMLEDMGQTSMIAAIEAQFGGATLFAAPFQRRPLKTHSNLCKREEEPYVYPSQNLDRVLRRRGRALALGICPSTTAPCRAAISRKPPKGSRSIIRTFPSKSSPP